MKKKSTKGFTLIELLIVVAIIAILAALAVPNFLEAQTRSKISRSKADMRTYATAMESYYVDNNSYPPCNSLGIAGKGIVAGSHDILEALSTPVAYLTSGLLPTPFKSKQRITNVDAQGQADSPTVVNLTAAELGNIAFSSYLYTCGNNMGRTGYSALGGNAPIDAAAGLKSGVWFLHSPGPTLKCDDLSGVLANASGDGNAANDVGQCGKLIYDPTNGTASFGAIWRIGGATNAFYGTQMSRAIANQR